MKIIYSIETTNQWIHVESKDGYVVVLDLLASPENRIICFFESEEDADKAIALAKAYHAEKEEEISYYSDDFKDVHGFRPSLAGVVLMAPEEIRARRLAL
jgi:hypothetical protein